MLQQTMMMHESSEDFSDALETSSVASSPSQEHTLALNAPWTRSSVPFGKDAPLGVEEEEDPCSLLSDDFAAAQALSDLSKLQFVHPDGECEWGASRLAVLSQSDLTSLSLSATVEAESPAAPAATTSLERIEQSPAQSHVASPVTGSDADGQSKKPERPADLRNLLVAQLHPSIDDRDLREQFEHYGPLLRALVMLDVSTGRSRGFGFVTFKEAGPAATAMAAMQGREVRGMKIRVVQSSHETFISESEAIWVRNVPAAVPRDRLSALFGTFGAIASLDNHFEVSTQAKRRNKFQVVCVRYETVDAARNAINALHGKRDMPQWRGHLGSGRGMTGATMRLPLVVRFSSEEQDKEHLEKFASAKSNAGQDQRAVGGRIPRRAAVHPAWQVVGGAPHGHVGGMPGAMMMGPAGMQMMPQPMSPVPMYPMPFASGADMASPQGSTCVQAIPLEQPQFPGPMMPEAAQMMSHLSHMPHSPAGGQAMATVGGQQGVFMFVPAGQTPQPQPQMGGQALMPAVSTPFASGLWSVSSSGMG